MKNTNLFLGIAAFAIGLGGDFHASAQTRDEPLELVNLRQNWQAARNQALIPIDEKYRRALDEMRTRFTTAGKLDEALAVDKEIKALQQFPKGPGEAQPEATPSREEMAAELIGVTVNVTFNSGSEPGGNGPITIAFGKDGKLTFQMGSQTHSRSYIVNEKGTISVDPTSNGTRSWTLRPNKDLSGGTVESSSGAKGRFQIAR